jgi:hypothetical protein
VTNFAARLVARAIGRTLGPTLAVLTPRPMSRFEPSAMIETQAAAETAPADPAPATEALASARVPAWQGGQRASHNADAANFATPQATVRQPTNDDVSAATRAPARNVPTLALPSHRLQGQQQLPVPTRDGALPSDQTLAKTTELVIPPQAELASASIKSSVQDDPIGLDLPVRVPGQDARIDQGHSASKAFSSASPRPDWVAPSPAPAVSIGKIEVQFLPQEPRVQSSRPQPQRTRGFDTYTRARRGQPR